MGSSDFLRSNFIRVLSKMQGYCSLQRLIANLFLVAHSNDQGHILLQTVERDIPAGAKADRPFLKLWVHVIDRTASIGMVCNDLHPVTDRTCRTSGGIRVLLSKKTIEALNICQRFGRSDQTWHSGGS